MAKSQFTSARLEAGKVVVAGPLERESTEGEVEVFRFLIVQGDLIVEGPGDAEASGWRGEAAAQGLRPGAAVGFGVLVLVSPGDPAGNGSPDFATTTWSEPITLDG